ncbi:MAG: hypothetical protein KJI69_01055 [Patescibacteria group bacterium]|nr:hypothetical protein [Patescibacteria group bacterium]
MKIFEFHFNPKSKSNRLFKSIFYEPATQREQQLGNMYVVGELVNAIPKNARLIQRISSIVKTQYYSSRSLAQIAKGKKKETAEIIFKGTLQKVNEFLSAEINKGNVDWLGNLNVAICTIIPRAADNQILNVSKTGSVVMLLARRGKFTNIGENIEKSEKDAVRLKQFSSIIAGEVTPGDKVFIITKELYDALSKQKLLSDLVFATEEGQLKALFETKKKELTGVSGILFVLLVEELIVAVKQEKKTLVPKKLPQISLPSSFRIPQIQKPQVSLPNVFNSKLPSFTLPIPKRTAIFASLFILILIAGFFLFKEEQSSELRQASSSLKRAEALQVEATRALNKEQGARANALMQEAWQLVEPYTTLGNAMGLKIAQFKQNLERELAPLNNIEFIEDPELILTLNSSPKHMILAKGVLYFSNPFSSLVITYNTSTQELKETSASRNLKFATVVEGTPTFFAEPNLILFYENNQWGERQLQFSSSDTHFELFESFEGSLYTYDISSHEIIKYTSPLSSSRAPAVGILWLSSQTKQKPTPYEGGNAIAVDGNVWIVSGLAELQRYFKGTYRETLNPALFPFLTSIEKLYTKADLPHLYILDKKENRVVILTKFGDVVRQYMSPELNAIEDFAVSKDGQTIFILNNKKVYQIDITTLVQQ